MTTAILIQTIEAILLFIIIVQTLTLIAVLAKTCSKHIKWQFICFYSFLIVIFALLKGWI